MKGAAQPLARGARFAVLSVAFAALLFDGFDLGLMPLASFSVTKDLIGPAYTATLGGDWTRVSPPRARFLSSKPCLRATHGAVTLGNTEEGTIAVRINEALRVHGGKFEQASRHRPPRQLSQ